MILIPNVAWRCNACSDPNSPCKCNKCSWLGSSEEVDGGGQIADTGDYGDIYCPKCGSTDIDETDNNIIKLSIRSLLQKVGTDAIRDVIHPNTWIIALFADYKLVSAKFGTIDYSKPDSKFEQIGDESILEVPNWIITDTRFPNEIEAIKKRGGITINVVRNNGTRTIDIHPSETSLDTYIFDHVLDNDSDIDSLMVKVRTLLQTLKLIE